MKPVLRILNLEDEPNDTDLIKAKLKKDGVAYEMTRVETEKDFVAAIQQGGVDLILSDFKLPAFDGLSALAIAKEKCPDIPFIFVSGAIGEEIAIETLKNGATDYVLKENLSRLPASVRRAMNESEERAERKRAECERIVSEKRFADIARSSGDWIWEVDANGKYTFASGRVKEILGYIPEEIIGKTPFEMMPEEEGKRVGKIFKNIVANKEAIVDLENWNLSKEGKLVCLLTSGIPVIDGRGELIGYRGLDKDITERKRAEGALVASAERLKKTLGATVQAIASVVETRDPYTAGHQRRVAHLAGDIATEMAIPSEKIEGIRLAGAIHDLGKISIPAEILSMPRKLTVIEFSLIKTHPQTGYDILKNIEFAWPVAQIVLQHHERMDGSGYPNGLKGDEILLEARILCLADVVEAMASHRPYRPALGIKAAMEEIEKNRGIAYDRSVADACLKLFNEKGYKIVN